MSDSVAPRVVPAGWYADPAGSPQQRWWDGFQWSESMRPQPHEGGMPMAVPFGTTTPYSHQSVAFAPLYGANPATPYVWAIALSPLITLLELVVLFAIGAMTFDALMDTSAGVSVVDSADLITRIVGYVLVVTLAIFDNRELSRRGIEKPFHWAFAFLGVVYIIGRSVVVQRRTGRGLAPLFVWIGCWVASLVIPLAVGIAIGLAYSNEFS